MISERLRSEIHSEKWENIEFLTPGLMDFSCVYLSLYFLNVSHFSALSCFPLTHRHHHGDDSVKTFVLAHSDVDFANISGSDKFPLEHFLKRASPATLF